jgi:hypothetical protein
MWLTKLVRHLAILPYRPTVARSIYQSPQAVGSSNGLRITDGEKKAITPGESGSSNIEPISFLPDFANQRSGAGLAELSRRLTYYAGPTAGVWGIPEQDIPQDKGLVCWMETAQYFVDLENTDPGGPAASISNLAYCAAVNADHRYILHGKQVSWFPVQYEWKIIMNP